MIGGGGVLPGGGENRRNSAPSHAGDAPFHDGIDSGDTNTNEKGGSAVNGSIGDNRGGGKGFTAGKRRTTTETAV